MARNAHIRPCHVEAIEKLIHVWDRETLTWDALCDASMPILGYRPSRSGLSAHVLKAFQARKKGLKVRAPENRPMPGSLAAAARAIALRDAEIATLKRQNTELTNKFRRWLYNAHRYGVTPDKLDQPLAEMDLG